MLLLGVRRVSFVLYKKEIKEVILKCHLILFHFWSTFVNISIPCYYNFSRSSIPNSDGARGTRRVNTPPVILVHI